MINNKAMFKLTYGLYVLTATDGKDNGCIINTAVQQTSAPLTVAITVNKQNLTHDMIQKTGKFNISALTVNTTFDLFKRFGMQSGKTADKFSGFSNCHRSENGLYVIDDFSNSFMSLKVIKSEDVGTHTWFLGEVTEAEVFSDAEGLTYGYYQAHIKPKPADAPKGKVVWRCKICGYIYEGDPIPPDFICPICKHGAVDFERLG